MFSKECFLKKNVFYHVRFPFKKKCFLPSLKKKSFKEKEFLTRKKDVFKENVSKIFFPF